jgi:hypothetical protein
MSGHADSWNIKLATPLATLQATPPADGEQPGSPQTVQTVLFNTVIQSGIDLLDTLNIVARGWPGCADMTAEPDLFFCSKKSCIISAGPNPRVT